MPTPQAPQPGNIIGQPGGHIGGISNSPVWTVPTPAPQPQGSPIDFGSMGFPAAKGKKKEKRAPKPEIDEDNPCGNPEHRGMAVRNSRSNGLCFGCNYTGALMQLSTKPFISILTELRRRPEILPSNDGPAFLTMSGPEPNEVGFEEDDEDS